MSNAQTPEARPTAAGIYDYYLGGTAHTPADAAAGAQISQVLPEIVDAASANRGFLQRAVKRMARDLGIRQFLDLGSGLPTERNTHDVLAEVIPDGRVVYVDFDPVVVARANEILGEVRDTAAICADVRDVDVVLDHPETRRLIDFRQPVGLLLVAVLHFLPDDANPWELVQRYVDAIPAGSYVALSHGCLEQYSGRAREALARVYAATPNNAATDRSRTEIERFLKGLEILPPYPGAAPELAFVGVWGAEDPAAADTDGSRMTVAAVARKS